jgi:hypothetical protein
MLLLGKHQKPPLFGTGNLFFPVPASDGNNKDRINNAIIILSKHPVITMNYSADGVIAG